jgi:hypothetical protein
MQEIRALEAKDALWALSNIAKGGTKMIQVLIEAGIPEFVVKIGYERYGVDN